MTNRLFIALDFDEDVLNEIIKLRDEISEGYKVRWEQADKLHLTLKFLGDVETGRIEEITGILDKSLKDFGCINSCFDKFGIFKKFREPKILWIGIEATSALKALHLLVDDIISPLGFPREKRKFTPHLTLLRIKKYIDTYMLEKFTGYQLDPVPFNSCSVSLIKSDLKAEGSSYTVLKNFNLKIRRQYDN